MYIYEWWYKNGKKHRENDHPAKIYYYENGSKFYEYWYKNGRMQRENDQPASIEWYDDWSVNQ